MDLDELFDFSWPLTKPSHIPAELSNVDAFLEYLKVGSAELAVIKKHRSNMYSQFIVPKKAGGSRRLNAPNKRLKYLQRLILLSLEKIYKPRIVVHGFCRGRSPITNAGAHLGRRHIVNIDLKDFFPSIAEARVSGLLVSIGLDGSVADHICAICCLSDGLPQGAPTSPILSNMICLKLDKQIMRFCRGHRVRFTRYADDLTLSTFSQPGAIFQNLIPVPGQFLEDELTSELRSIIHTNGFEINSDKLRYFGDRSRREVTGLVINEKVNVPRIFVRSIRWILHDIEKRGYAEAQSLFSSKSGKTIPLQHHIRGKILWIAQVKGVSDPVFRNYALRYNKTFSDHIAVGPPLSDVYKRAVWIVDSEYPDGHDEPCSQGTCFFTADGALVTAYHCVEGASKIEVYKVDEPSQKYSVDILAFDAHKDLAVLSHTIPEGAHSFLEISNVAVQNGDLLSCLGFPDYGPGDDLSVSPGTVISLPKKHGVQQISVGQLIHQGNSGGPLINRSNEVVGVAHKGGMSETRNLAISIDELNGILD